MFCITHSKTINAPRALVWDVITNTAEYPLWNTFVVACDTTFEEGAPIRMKVCAMSDRPMGQTEKILTCMPGEFLDYGMKIPFGILSSTRRHILADLGPDATAYQSVFALRGILSPVVRVFLGRRLKRGFTDMTEGIVRRAEELRRTAKDGHG